jgi:tetratricopeptide (TPR) repeat protein
MGPSGLRPTLVSAAVIAVAAVVVYAGTLGHGFVLDDGPEVVDNLFIRSPSELPRILTSGSWEGAGEGNPPIYRPLTTLTYALNHAAGGLAPFGYHLVNVVLHAVGSVLVLAVGLRLGLALAPAALAGLLFAVHPVHVEAVANVAGRKDVLVTVFFLAAVLAHAAALRRAGSVQKPPRRYGPAAAGAAAAFAGALFSKENGLVLVGLLAAHDLLFARGDWKLAPRRAAALYAVYAAEIGVYLWGRSIAVGSFVFPMLSFEENPVAFAPAGVRILTAVAVLGKGLLLLVAPVTLSPDYSYRAIPAATGLGDPRVLASLAAAGLLTVLALWGRRRWPAGLFALLWYGLTIFPASNLVVRIGTIFGERLLYLPSVAFCLAGGSLLGALLLARVTPAAGAGARAGAPPPPAPGNAWPAVALQVGVALPLAVLAWRTVAHARVWADEPALYASAARTQPDSSRARRLHGGGLMEQGRPAEAAREFERALEILSDPSVPPAVRSRPRLELGVAWEQLGRLEDALRLYEAVAAEDPGNADAPWRMGVVRWREGRKGEAVDLWQRAVALDPRHARAMSDLGIASLLAGDAAGAKAMWRRAMEADPTVASVWYRIGNLHEREGDLAAARAAWAEFLRRSPGRYPEWRAEVEAKLGKEPVRP